MVSGGFSFEPNKIGNTVTCYLVIFVHNPYQTSMQLKKTNPLLLLLLLNIIVCLFFFYPVIGHLNHVMLSGGGDGIKNYFTYLYFIKNDFGPHFTGMNYPFGENIVFTDNMPILAWSIAKLKTWFPGIVNYGLVLMHSTFIISYFLCSFYVYKILQLFDVKGWWAMASAIFIAYFSPQFSRIFGHFSLGLTCFFPMMIYWLMQYDRSSKIKYLVYLFCCVLLFTFLHVYYLAFAFVLILAYSFAYLITPSKPFLKKIKKIVPLLVPVVSAIAIFKIYLKITDTVTDRPVYPIGYLGAGATGPDILTSGHNFIGHYAFLWLFGGSPSKGTEGYTYLGFITILTAIYLLYRIIKSIVLRIKSKKKIPTHPVRAYRKWLIVALVTLLFSMGVPFVWGLDFLIDYFSVFRQFRTLGRFSWIFYYLIMIYASIFLFRWFVNMRLKGYRKQYLILATIIVSVWLIEWNGYGQEIRQRSSEPNYEGFYLSDKDSWSTWLHQQGYPSEKFQGLIGLPYMHIGSEKLGIQEDYSTTMYNGAQIAYETGLKMVDVMMSRTSWSQTFENVRLCDGPFTPKAIIRRFGNKPFLVYVSHNVPLTSGEQALLRYAKFIGKKNELDLYELDLKNMEQQDIKYTDSIMAMAMAVPQHEGLLQNDSAFVYINHFDNDSYQKPFMGKGACSAVPATNDEMHLLLSVPVEHRGADSLYTISAWFLCYDNLPNNPSIFYKQYDGSNNFINEGECSAGQSLYVDKFWFKAHKEFIIRPEVKKIDLYIKGSKKDYIALDELMIHPVNSIYFYKANDSTLMLNNRPVKIKR